MNVQNLQDAFYPQITHGYHFFLNKSKFNHYEVLL